MIIPPQKFTKGILKYHKDLLNVMVYSFKPNIIIILETSHGVMPHHGEEVLSAFVTIIDNFDNAIHSHLYLTNHE